MWFICPIFSVICLSNYLNFLTWFMVFMGGWFGYEMAGFAFGNKLFSIHLYGGFSFAGPYRLHPHMLCIFCVHHIFGGTSHI
jgi:hypothetical protein